MVYILVGIEIQNIIDLLPGSSDVCVEVLRVNAGHHGIFLSVDDEGWTADQRQQLHADAP